MGDFQAPEAPERLPRGETGNLVARDGERPSVAAKVALCLERIDGAIEPLITPAKLDRVVTSKALNRNDPILVQVQEAEIAHM